jgi:energy-coupling factor transporter ATP-binding protein EcfA2
MLLRLYANNLRCLQNFTWELRDQRSSLLMGRSGSGKSTVLMILEILQKIARGANRAGSVVTPFDWSYFNTTLPMRLEIEIEINSVIYVYTIVFEWPDRFLEARIQSESLHANGAPVFSREKNQVMLPGGSSFFLDWHVFALPVITEKPGDKAISNVRTYLEMILIIDPIPSNIGGVSGAPTLLVEKHFNNYATCLRTLLSHKPSAYSVLEDYLKLMLPGFSSFENVPYGPEHFDLSVVFSDEATGQTLRLRFEQLSYGEKTFFIAGYVIAAMSQGLSPLCCWDEPDCHLPLPDVQVFIRRILTSVKKSPNGQLIATTHPETISTFASSGTYVLRRRSQFEPTSIHSLDDIKYDGDLIHAIIRGEV